MFPFHVHSIHLCNVLCKYVLGIILCGKQYYATNTDEKH